MSKQKHKNRKWCVYCEGRRRECVKGELEEEEGVSKR